MEEPALGKVSLCCLVVLVSVLALAQVIQTKSAIEKVLFILLVCACLTVPLQCLPNLRLALVTLAQGQPSVFNRGLALCLITTGQLLAPSS